MAFLTRSVLQVLLNLHLWKTGDRRWSLLGRLEGSHISRRFRWNQVPIITRSQPLRSQLLTHDGELGAGDVGPTHQPVVALVRCLALLDPEQVALTADTDVILVAAAQLLGALVPGQRDLWVVDLDLALKLCLFVHEDRLIGYVGYHSDRLQESKTRTLIGTGLNFMETPVWYGLA